ncbi:MULTISPECIES: carbamate kinase [unclassified Paraburkholderia]|uniref:carbamate kinase n=1 Tax=unclassified Paraburkholderia TaxID=2615204 RepID=UPI002AB74C6D|nr:MULTISPECIES: carbamate kinase [unclassified Paraburkholderia]
MRIVAALGGNALLRRGEPLTTENQLANIRRAARQLARLAPGNELIVAHGNGPQVGLLALQAAALAGVAGITPLDVLNAESEGMIGYLLEQELANALADTRPVATLLTRVQVSASDPAWRTPTKPIGPIYDAADAQRLAHTNGWSVAPDGAGWRRVVASPEPRRIVGIEPILWLLEHESVVIAAGGGGIPVVYEQTQHTWHGVEAVIDKDACSALLAVQLEASLFLIATDVDAVYLDWNTPHACALSELTVRQAESLQFAAGSMGPKVHAAAAFASQTGRTAVIGSLDQIEGMANGKAGTRVRV